ncbi:cation channel sperm-associated auxiliary subunit delta [Perognathus longimembris pacificus]|uniref:cation channel sperm-associated auxiliary subunit delta n=1 Tax=Perognathus longimembris pacificus TaxID=214514 RepID=UPI002019A498|nr:cation channel sperm-associated auxiliary subunit delta [Perognathus longimembris pacificus]
MSVWSLTVMVTVAAAAVLRLWPLARAQALCRVRTVRTGKVFNVIQQVEGEVLQFSSTTVLIRHPCEKNIAVYLGKQIFFTRDNFESSLLPFTIPEWTMGAAPSVTSAHFSGGALLLVANGKVFVYNYEDYKWFQSQGPQENCPASDAQTDLESTHWGAARAGASVRVLGAGELCPNLDRALEVFSTLRISHPVSHLSGDNCCFAKNALCADIGNNIFAYMRGEKLAETHIYFSNNGGYSFDLFTINNKAAKLGTLGGVFYFHPLSQIGILVVYRNVAAFHYLDHPLNRSVGMTFRYKSPMDVLLTPGLRGFLILWSKDNLLMSPNSGQLVNTIQLQEGEEVVFPSIFKTNITIHNMAANENELAVLTQESNLFYGNLGFLSTSVIKFVDQPVWSPEAALTFQSSGMLEILTPIPDSESPAFDFQKCSLNIQAILMDPNLQIGKCKVELLEGKFDEDLYIIDMKSSLLLSADFIPRPGSSPIPLVMVSNPHSLGLHATITEVGNTLDGHTKYKLDIELEQQQHSGKTDPRFTSSIKRPTLSTLTVDMANKDISCVDMKPLSTLISIGCDLRKKIVVQNKVSACSKGILDAVELQRNYTYVIEKESYDPNFLGHKATNDLFVTYPYKELGCPRLVYFNAPWKPVVELWQGEQLQEEVKAEYVLLEVNGLFTYSYSLTAGTALCRAQPQNWTTVKQGSTSWNRENYVSCWEPNEDAPLLWPDVPYQILGGPTENEIIFDQRNGIYIFYLSIVDPYYSYCHLDTTFSIYVYGAYPLPTVLPELTIFLLVSSTLLVLWLAYAIPKLLHTETGLQFLSFWRWLGALCVSLCTCSWLGHLLRRVWGKQTSGQASSQPEPPELGQDPDSK